MDTKNVITRTTVTFVVLAIAGILMAVGSKTMADAVDQLILIAVGSALFGAALSFFLVRIFSLTEK
jgi:NhaP-type Na+/H+ or K+/H+ antiporter